jgi:hypothetical protein
MNVINEAISASTSMSGFQQYCKSHLISGCCDEAILAEIPIMQHSFAIIPDILHQLYQGVVKHLANWCTGLMSKKELDSRICTLPPCFSGSDTSKGLV